MLSSDPSSENEGEGHENLAPLKIFFSLSKFASIRAASRSSFASAFNSLMNFNGDGHTSGSAEEGFNRAAHAR